VGKKTGRRFEKGTPEKMGASWCVKGRRGKPDGEKGRLPEGSTLWGEKGRGVGTRLVNKKGGTVGSH